MAQDLRGTTGQSGDKAATPKGRPGPDIEEKRKLQKRLRWDTKTVELALSRIYPSRAHAVKEQM